MSFTTLGLSPDLQKTLADKGYTEPTPIQKEVIPVALRGRDLLAAAQRAREAPGNSRARARRRPWS